jgi:hypothetical protein
MQAVDLAIGLRSPNSLKSSPLETGTESMAPAFIPLA